MAHKPTDRDRLIEVLATANGFHLPLRVGQAMAIERIYRFIIDAILAAGWEPTGLRPEYEESQKALSSVTTGHRELVERLGALAETWEGRGFGVANGRQYAQELRASITEEKK